MWESFILSDISFGLIHGSKWSLVSVVNGYQMVPIFSSLCIHITNTVFFKNKILPSLRTITGSICLLGSSPEVFSLYVSLSLSDLGGFLFQNALQ